MLFNKHDILIISETHFLKRHKCPNGFKLIARSSPVGDARRGGVAVYRRPTVDMKFRVFMDVCPDVVVLLIEGSRVFLIASYFTPETSIKYRFPAIFSLIKFILKNLSGYRVYMLGDLNARCGTPIMKGLTYTTNPDKIMNMYGKKLVDLCKTSDMIMVNGLVQKSKIFDSNFTFFHGRRPKSQNDWCVTNAVEDVVKFKILPRVVVSDHVPISLVIRIPAPITLQLIEKVCIGNFSYDMYDRSKVLKPKVTLQDVDTVNLIAEFNNTANIFSEKLDLNEDINSLVIDLNEHLYELCSSKRNRQKMMIPEDKRCLSSSNFRAIAEANLQMYSLSIQRNDDPEQSFVFFETWSSNIEFAKRKEKEEYNEKVNRSWRSLSKDNPKLLWRRINYKEEDPDTKAMKNSSLTGDLISNYFKKIFQAERLKNNPTVADIVNELDNYTMYVPLLDDCFTIDELNIAIAKNGNGVGIDGIDKKIAMLFPSNLRLCILRILNYVFSNCYPELWKQLLLRPEEKKGHTNESPKLRGVAISQLLPTLYDILIYNRFNMWYIPNPEQAGFVTKQGCPLQIFAIYIMMEYLKSIGKTLYIGFMDYEKAFDFVNRAHILNHLREKGAGAKFVKAIASMYGETYYVPKVCNRIGEAITAKHGVTQGRQSSTSLFSFEVHEMAEHTVVNESPLNGIDLLQLADDTALLADDKYILLAKFIKCLIFSDDCFMSANIQKTVYLHLSDVPDTDDLIIDDSKRISAAEND